MSELMNESCEACRADVATLSNLEIAEQFTNQVGELAELHAHHPALLTEWGYRGGPIRSVVCTAMILLWWRKQMSCIKDKNPEETRVL